MNFLEELSWYGKWEETSREKVSKEVVESLSKISVVVNPGRHDEEYDIPEGLQLKIYNKRGQYAFLKLSKQSTLEEGDEVKPSSLVEITLSKQGEEDIVVYDGEKL